MTTDIIHDPLLFFPYGSSSYSTEPIPSSSSSTGSSPTTSSSLTLTTMTDEHFDWNDIMSNIKKTMFNTTGATLPSPARYMSQHKRAGIRPDTDPIFFFNDALLELNDVFVYRQLRAENILYRMLNCCVAKVDVDPTSLMRITKGVFVANKLHSNASHSPPLPSLDLNDMSDLSLDDTAAVDTFHFGNMQQFMLQSRLHQQMEVNDFLPFSYTFGARFTNPYQSRDVMIRGGRLPTWCQTLFLNECLQRMPLETGVEYDGLFPFAPHVTVSFDALSTFAKANRCQDTYPDLLMSFEKYAMELTEPEIILADSWSAQQEQIMEHILVCDIPQQAVPILTQLATLWA
ncbi:hypothetical protein DM01DRAFT_1333138, partial [Hesseltinella vesiculosa]